ncbi:MAG: phosphate regulon sensor histidine kinase PhoR [Steroidobacteraceae bacterium]|nr:phosphate regulon sensor histidine kinase PhoR [Steroidobacteraceae bacterium]MCC7198765.1 phosphate regulon sensor histidine kinase PhoR [Gammaproteobacteria bacterium]
MKAAWSFAVGRVAALLAFAVMGGLIFGGMTWWLVGVLAIALVEQFVNLFRLQRWLRLRSSESPPDLSGVWGDVVALVGRVYRRKQYHKRRAVELVREFRRMTSALPDGLVILNPEREIVWFNGVASHLLGLRRKQDLGLRIETLLRQPEFQRYLAGSDHGTPVIVRSPSNAELNLALQYVDYGGEYQLLRVRDVSRELSMEAMRKDFVANASHELRSPLTVIAGYLDTMLDDPDLDPAWQPPVAEMRRQSERMGLIVGDLLELSRLEASDREAPMDPVDVAGLLSLIRKDALATEGAPRAIKLALESTARLAGAENEVHSVLANLVTNAVKFTGEEGSIDIRWWTDQEGGHVSVTDTGIGIAPEHLPRLTERFYRVDKGRSRKMGGSGLGLAIVKHAMQRHGGRLQIESVEGKGSTFTCHFPARRILA